MRIDFSVRSFAPAFVLLVLGIIAAGCSSQVAGLSDNAFVDGTPDLPGEPTGSVPRGPAIRSRQLEHPPVEKSQAFALRLPVPAAVRHPDANDIISAPLRARPQVILLRGGFDVFSTGLDTLAEELRAKGIDAKVAGHLSWSTAVLDIRRERAAGKTGPLVLVGHSQGANNAIVVARSIKAQNIKIDLLVTLAPFLPPLVPSNVVRAINYYQFPGWGSPLIPEHGFEGTLSNINIAGDLTTFHITIDKSAKIHEHISREIAAL
jgi:acetyl esterase/lipase